MHAHTFYPPYLILNSEEVPLAGNDGGRTGKTYSHYRIFEEAVRFIKDNRKKPFFATFPSPLPMVCMMYPQQIRHGNFMKNHPG